MIDFKSTLKMAVVSLKINKMRSMLTSLGIIIGVSAVIIMLAVGTGASQKIAKDMESMGSNLLMIRSGSVTSGGVRMGMDQDDLVFIPITTAQKKVFGTDFPGTVKMINVQAQNADVMTQLEDDIKEILRKRHHIGKNQEDDFEVRNLAEMQETIKSSAKTMSLLLGAIASVSLLVGGIGIMNIMLVSVTERTKEIGIRMAIGAKASDIRIQFLIESFLLSIIGGLIGVLIGVVGAKLMEILGGMNISISSFSIFLSLGFSGAIGVLFGYYPAFKASLLNPIDALRYE